MAMKKAVKKTGASDKAKKAQSARMTAQAKAPAKAAMARTNEARFKKIEGTTRGGRNRFATRAEIEKNPYKGSRTMAWEKNATSKNTNIPKGVIAMLKSNDNEVYRDRNEKLMIRGKYKGAGSKPKGKK